MAEPPKRFVVFAGDVYYPGGGWLDFHSSHHFLEDATAAAKAEVSHYKWSQVVDITTGERLADYDWEEPKA